jgi:hypothetical protein
MQCRTCHRDLPQSVFRGKALSCRSCCAGMRRFRAVAGYRRHWRELRGPARDCVLAWETARLAFSRVLEPYGVRVEWGSGFRPVVTVVPRLPSC